MIFISYCHKDEPWKDLLVKHLGALRRQGRIDVWDDRRIGVGDDWLPAIDRSLRGADAAILLVSADFLDSRFIRDRELPVLLKRRRDEGLLVAPVIVRDCAWDRVDGLREIQARPKDGQTLAAMSEATMRSVPRNCCGKPWPWRNRCDCRRRSRSGVGWGSAAARPFRPWACPRGLTAFARVVRISRMVGQ